MSQSIITPKKKNEGQLNTLSGKEWIKSSKTWFLANWVSRGKKEIHPASFPEALVERFLSFFTKTGDWVLDPFVGTGTTMIVSQQFGRFSVGVELYEQYIKFANQRLKKTSNKEGVKSILLKGDSRNILDLFEKLDVPLMNFCLTSPPYWNQLSTYSDRNKKRNNKNLNCYYGDDALDLGNINDYNTFLLQQKYIFDDIYELMKNKSYLVVITNNVYKHGRLWPLAFDTLKTLSEKWVPKDEIIWCQDGRKLFPFGMFHSYIGNRCHHYCLVFQKVL